MGPFTCLFSYWFSLLCNVHWWLYQIQLVFPIKTQIWFFFIPLSIFNIILRLNFLLKLSPSNVMVELNLQIINLVLTLRLMVLCYALLAPIHWVKMGLLNVNTDMSLKRVLPLCFMLVFHYFFGLRHSQQLFISSTDSHHKLLMAKLPTSSCSENNQTTLCFIFLDVYAFLICEIMLLTICLPNPHLVSF